MTVPKPRLRGASLLSAEAVTATSTGSARPTRMQSVTREQADTMDMGIVGEKRTDYRRGARHRRSAGEIVCPGGLRRFAGFAVRLRRDRSWRYDRCRHATPYARRVRVAARVFPRERVVGHFHDTHGEALANIYAALFEGIGIFHASAAGIGGCPYARGTSGNAATVDVLYILHGLAIETVSAFCSLFGQRIRTSSALLTDKVVRNPRHGRTLDRNSLSEYVGHRLVGCSSRS
jgi:hypothetical protein